MRVNTKVRYGLRAMIEIAKDENTAGVLQKDISKEQDISVGYLDAIIISLKIAGLIINFAGKRSGYVLAKDVKEISVYDIYCAFEPDLSLVNCSCPSNECTRINICPTVDYWFQLNNVIRKNMMDTSLKSLLEKENLN